jgi:hypothetical protein
MKSMKPASVAWAQLSIALLLALATGCAESVNNSGRKTPEARWNDPSDNASDGKPDRTATDNDSTCLEDCSQYESPPCYKSVCNAVAGRCESVPADGEPCDDGLFCTAADSCLAGACFGGSGDACADTDLPVCHVARCDEPTDSCVPEGLANGAPCSSDNLCEVDGACTFGSDGLVACIGQPRDCTFSAGKDDCNDVACNPNTGSCEPIPVADGSWCADALDRCLLNTTCQSGICTSNSKRDCGHLSQGCDDGLCNPNTGSCVTQPVPAGGECAAAADECNAGICDASGSCLPVPLADGTACKKLCNTGATCQAGECAGGTEVDGCNGQSKLDLGGVHNCSIQDDGALWCWGYNGDSQLGLGDQTDRNTPTQVGTNADWSTIALGYSHSCGRKDNGTLWCWGYNKYGQLGLGDQTDRNTPTQVGTDADWSAIALGDNHSCGIKDNGTLWCWGYNDVGGARPRRSNRPQHAHSGRY